MGFKGKERAFEHSAGQYDEKYVSYLNGYNQALQDSKAPELLEMLKEAKSMIGVLKRSMLVHPDCELGSEFCDYTTNAQNLEDEIEHLIKSSTEVK